MRHYGILSSFQWRGRPECSEVPRGVCSWIRRIQRRLLRARADIARPVPHVAEWPIATKFSSGLYVSFWGEAEVAGRQSSLLQSKMTHTRHCWLKFGSKALL